LLIQNPFRRIEMKCRKVRLGFDIRVSGRGQQGVDFRRKFAHEEVDERNTYDFSTSYFTSVIT